MTKLSLVEGETRRLLGRLPPRKQQMLQESLVALCEAHWSEVRGPEPRSTLRRAVWDIRPPLAKLFVHLHGTRDPRLAEVLDSLRPAQALALLVLAEIGRGDIDGAHTAYEAMMPFESSAARDAHTRSVMAEFTGRISAKEWSKHNHRHPLWRAIAAIITHIGRDDLTALLEAIPRLARVQASPSEYGADPELQSLLDVMSSLGVVVHGLKGMRLQYSLRGEEKQPVPLKRMADILSEVRQQRRNR